MPQGTGSRIRSVSAYGSVCTTYQLQRDVPLSVGEVEKERGVRNVIHATTGMVWWDPQGWSGWVCPARLRPSTLLLDGWHLGGGDEQRLDVLEGGNRTATKEGCREVEANGGCRWNRKREEDRNATQETTGMVWWDPQGWSGRGCPARLRPSTLLLDG